MIVISYWWNHHNVSVLFKVVEEFVFNSDDAPDRSSEGLNCHVYKSYEPKMFQEFRRVRILYCENVHDPPESENYVLNHCEVVKVWAENHFVSEKSFAW